MNPTLQTEVEQLKSNNMKWNSPQCVTACGSLLLGFMLIFMDFFLADNNEIHDSSLWVLGQAFLYAGAIFGVKGYVDGKFVKWKENINNKVTKTQ